MEKYRDIKWNNELRAMREPERLKNQRKKWQSIVEEENIFNKQKKNDEIPEPISLKKPQYKENNLYRKREIFQEERKIFIPVFFAILAAAIVIGGFIRYMQYLDAKEIKNQTATQQK